MKKKSYNETIENITPKHIAIIMDGNGRWAKKNNLPRFAGHREGVNTVRDITKECGKLGIEFLTLFTFSSENWLRPLKEVNALMKLLAHTLGNEIKNLNQNNVRFSTIGDIEKLPDLVKSKLKESIKITQNNTGLNLILALNYGGKQEIITAVKRVAKALADNSLKLEELTIPSFEKFLWTADIPNPDLLIRTGGDLRISNFMLWQIAYTELYVTDTYWPDFNTKCLHKAINNYKNRERRFGKLIKKSEEEYYH